MARRGHLIATSAALTLLVVGGCGSGDGSDGSAASDAASRQEEVAARGAEVMPFDLDATVHTFTETTTGGVQTVTVRDAGDDAEVAAIRGHLADEADRFRQGDFSDPAAIHGTDMPGLAELEAGHEAITVTYDERPDGARITYRTDDPELVDAIHRWFDAQLADHGDHAQPGSAMDHDAMHDELMGEGDDHRG